MILNILSFLILILIAFHFLIFIEIIEINICNISYNTKKNIEIRSGKESIIEFKHTFSLTEEEEEKTEEDNKTDTTFSTITDEKN